MGTKLIRDYHTLRRNLKLNDNYISNDGQDEGISIADDGDVTISSTDVTLTLKDGSDTFAEFYESASGPTFKFYESAGGTDYFSFTAATNGMTVLTTHDAAAYNAAMILDPDGYLELKSYGGSGVAESLSSLISLKPGSKVYIDKDLSETSASTVVALHVDVDKTGASSSDNGIYGIDVELDNTTATGGINVAYGIRTDVLLTHAIANGTAIAYGANFKAVGSANGTSTTIGVKIATGGDADTIRGLEIASVNTGTDLMLRSDENAVDYCTLHTTDDGATTLATVNGGSNAAHLTLDVAGNITLDAAGGIYLDAENGECRLTDDSAGNDVFTPTHADDITTKAYVDSIMYDHKVCNYASTSSLIQYVPLAGYILEGSLFNANEYRAMVMPYDGSLIRIIWRSEIEQTSGTFGITMLISDDGTEIPTTTNFLTRLVSFTLAANTTYVHDPGVTAAYTANGNQSNAFSKGQIIAVGIDPTVAPYDTNCTLVFKYDTST